nr:hypothetical protein [Nanoarchaeum sp.]
MDKDISLNNFSKNDILRKVKIPKIDEELAYFCGILAGDGCLASRKLNRSYDVYCGGNLENEKEFYDYRIKPLIKKLFNLDIEMKYFPGGVNGNNGVYGFRIGSKAIYSFLLNTIRLPSGKKYDNLQIPLIFKNNNKLKLNFIRGIADTDLSFCLKKRYTLSPYYPVISLTSKSEKFISEIHSELVLLGFKPTNFYKVIQKDERIQSGKTIKYLFELNGPIELLKWESCIGFRQLKHVHKFNEWVIKNKDTLKKTIK